MATQPMATQPMAEQPMAEQPMAEQPMAEQPTEPVMQLPPPLGPSYWSPPPAPGVNVGRQSDGMGPDSVLSVPGPAAASGFGPELDDTFVGGAGPTLTRRPRRRLASAMAALVVVAAVGTVIVVIGAGKSAQAAVIDSVNSTIADRTAHVRMNLTEHSPKFNVTGTGTGGIDFSQNALELKMTIDAAGQQVPVTGLYVGGSVYESIAGLDQLVPGKSWISIDLGSLATSSQSSNAFGTGSNPTAMLRLLAVQGNTVVPLGSSTIDGTPVQGYSVKLNASNIESQLAHANLPAWITSALSKVDIESVTNKVFIDSSGLLRRYSMSMAETVASAGQVDLDESLDFSDYGTSVTVSAPPAGEVISFDQFLQAAEAAGQSSPS